MYRDLLIGCLSVCCCTLPLAVLSAAEQGEPNYSRRDGDNISFSAHGRQALEYRAKESPFKPYVSKLFTPGGVQILRDSPPDHKHHHGLMFALGADKVDFWGEEKGAGTEKDRRVGPLESIDRDGLGRSGFTQELDWIDPQSGKPLLTEQRRIDLIAAPEIKATLLTWQTAQQTAKGKGSVALDGHHYYGLGMRFVESMDAVGDFLTSDNKESETVRGSEKLTPARWAAYRSKADNKPVTVALFESPENPRHPNKFFTMRPPFAYLSATLNLWKQPMTLKEGESLKLKYGVAAWDGHVEAAEIEKTYQSWLKIEKVGKP